MLRQTAPGSCGIPSTWRSPTARRPGGSPRRNRRPILVQLCPRARRVVALGEVDGVSRSGHPGDLPARRGHALAFKVQRRSAVGRSRAGQRSGVVRVQRGGIGLWSALMSTGPCDGIASRPSPRPARQRARATSSSEAMMGAALPAQIRRSAPPWRPCQIVSVRTIRYGRRDEPARLASTRSTSSPGAIPPVASTDPDTSAQADAGEGRCYSGGRVATESICTVTSSSSCPGCARLLGAPVYSSPCLKDPLGRPLRHPHGASINPVHIDARFYCIQCRDPRSGVLNGGRIDTFPISTSALSDSP